QAQPKDVGTRKIGKINRLYFGMNMDSYLLSSSNLQKGGGTSGMPLTSEITVPRFTGFLHIGPSAHYNFSRKFGLLSGLSVKNLGFIEKVNTPDSTIIRRNYSI